MWTAFIGFMGSGKSTAVRQMRQTTGRVAYDLNPEIERRCGRGIAELLERDGETGLRRLELEALSELEAAPALLLATTSGSVESADAVRLLRRRGVVFWLDAPWEVLRARLQRQPDAVQPWLDQEGWEGLRCLYARRLRLYAAAADFRLRTDRLAPEDVAQTALLRGLIWRRRLARIPS